MEHTSIGIVEYKGNEAALMNFGVGYDVVGKNFDLISAEARQQVVEAFPAAGSNTTYWMPSWKASNIKSLIHPR